ncbi:MAG: choice-of-anchor A family protein, partial [Actinomycetota bacterium]
MAGLVALVASTLTFHVAPPSLEALNPPGFWECTGPNCPPGTYPTIGNGPIQFRDDTVNVFVGGDMTVTGSAAESEGLTVVLGNMELNKTGGSNRYDVGEAGVGSRVTPNPGNDFLVVGGDVTVAGGQQIVAGATQNSVARHAGTLSGNLNAGSPGTVVQDPAATSSFGAIPAALQTLSTCLAGLTA